MSIRQLTFEEGEALNIRECIKLPRNTTLEELKALELDESALIVKSGKSYFNVEQKPEIFEKATEFSLDSLTSADKRDMQDKDINPVFADESSNPMSLLYQNTSEEEEEEQEEYKRKTYYLRVDQIEALDLISFDERRMLSEVVRDLLDVGIKTLNEERGKDYFAEAEKRLQAKPRKVRRNKKKS